MNGIGIDMAEVARFAELLGEGREAGLKKLFTEDEIAYCLGHAEPASHLAGMFAAKEAASKALGTDAHPFVSIEIRHAENGAPEAWSGGSKLSVRVSITHTQALATAVAVA